MPLPGAFGVLSRETFPPHPTGCGVGASPPEGDEHAEVSCDRIQNGNLFDRD